MKITRIKAEREEKKLIVVAYCRVSTRTDVQEESLETQEEYYKKLICSTEDWEFGGVYSDERSGLRAEDREGFQQMIADGEAGKFDLVLCKSVSRFSRNVVECQRYAERLLRKNIAVSFEKEHLKTSDPTSRFVFSMMCSIAQDESRSISENNRWTQQQRVKRGEYTFPKNGVIGYDSVNGKPVPNADAQTIRMIFEMYADGRSYKEISKATTEAGVLSLRTKKPLSKSNIHGMLTNEIYVGDKLLQKTPPKDYLTKKVDPDIEYISNYLVDDHEAIVDRATWDRAQERLESERQRRKDGCAPMSNSHFLYGKMFCSECREPFCRKSFYDNPRKGREYGTHWVWMCRDRNRGKEGKGCRNAIIREDLLLEKLTTQMGWEWNGAAHFPKERFLKEVRRVEIGEGCVTICTKES